MPQPQWFIIDKARNIDQKAWLLDRIKRDVLNNLGRLPAYKAEIIQEFEDRWPQDIKRRWYKGSGDGAIVVREETTEEALVRTAKRPQQLRNWFGNHLPQLIEDLRKNTTPPPQHFALQDYPGEPVGRARSPRDIFIAENPQIREAADTASSEAGIESRSERQSRRNQAYSAAWSLLSEDEKRQYTQRSEEDKAAKKKLRDSAKTKASESDLSKESQRGRLLENLQYSVHTDIAKLAEDTGMEVVVILGGEDGSGELRKWLFSSRAENDPYNFLKTIRDRGTAAHGILQEFDEHLRRTRVAKSSDPNMSLSGNDGNTTASTDTPDALGPLQDASMLADTPSIGGAAALLINTTQNSGDPDEHAKTQELPQTSHSQQLSTNLSPPIQFHPVVTAEHIIRPSTQITEHAPTAPAFSETSTASNEAHVISPDAQNGDDGNSDDNVVEPAVVKKLHRTQKSKPTAVQVDVPKSPRKRRAKAIASVSAVTAALTTNKRKRAMTLVVEAETSKSGTSRRKRSRA